MSKSCPNCHQEIQDDARFCNNCGFQQPMPGSQSGYQSSSSQTGYQQPSSQQPGGYQQAGYQQQGQARPGGTSPAGEEVFSAEDVQRNKVISALAYFIFFLPLVAAPDSPFGKFHANQGLLLLILAVAGNFILGIIPFFDLLFVPLFSMLCFVLAIMGLINTLNGKARELPIIGQYRILH